MECLSKRAKKNHGNCQNEAQNAPGTLPGGSQNGSRGHFSAENYVFKSADLWSGVLDPVGDRFTYPPYPPFPRPSGQTTGQKHVKIHVLSQNCVFTRR